MRLDLSPERWAELRGLLDLALALPDEDRASWIEALPATQQDLVPTLREMLAVGPALTAHRLLDTLPRVDTSAFAPAPTRGREGDRVGPYRLLHELGTGGMASVWLAERVDMLQRRQVALKLPHGAWRRAGLAERMAREREILSGLEHPHIARLYDAGVDADGQPYLALEFVRGERIDAHCQRHGLDTRARLLLFVQVARAVAYAHANLVVHRDLKPGNVLVSDAGDVKLLDFGIAKLLDTGRAETSDLTRHLGQALTPEYASPEQLQGQPVTTAADVYSLGVVLYELLAGQRPAADEAARRPPSTQVADPLRRHALQGDVDTVVMKALRHDVAERYDTAAALADDIERHLRGDAVLARPDSAWDRVRRFVRRHTLAVGAGAAVAVALLVGSALATWQATRALQEQRRAEQVKDFIAAIFKEANPFQAGSGKALSGADLLRLAKDRLAATPPADVRTQVELLTVLGESLIALEDAASAQSVLQQAAELAARGLGPVHPLTLRSQALRAEALRVAEQYTASRQLLEPLLPDLRRQRAEHPAPLSGALLTLAHMAGKQTRFDDALALIDEGLAVVREHLDNRHPNRVELLALRATTLRVRGLHGAQALAAADEAVLAAQAVHPGNARHPVLAEVRNIRGFINADNGRLTEAVEDFRRVLADTEALFGPTSRRLATRLGASAEIFSEAGLLREARTNAERAFELLTPYAPAGSRLDGARHEVLGLAHLWMRSSAEAARYLGQAEDIFRPLLGHSNPAVLITQRNRALALVHAGRLDEAAPLLAAVRATTPQLARDGFDANAWIAGMLERWAGRPQAALALQQQALASLPTPDPYPIARGRILAERGLAELALDRPQAARASLEQSLAVFRSRPQAMVAAQADAELGLARLDLGEGRVDTALARLRTVQAFWRDLDGDSPWTAEATWWLARAELAGGRTDLAARLQAEAAPRLARSPFAGHRALLAARAP